MSIRKLVGVQDQFVLFSGEKDEVQSGLNDGEFLIQK